MASDPLIPSDDLIDAVRVGRGDFAQIGDQYIAQFVREGWIGPESAIVDIGCGLGRLARPLVGTFAGAGSYRGFDVNPTSIEWCRQRYAGHPRFRFEWVDAHSVVYNPAGRGEAKAVRFDIADDAVDFANLTSVFTHMLIDDVAAYLAEIARMLRVGGRCHITYFLLSGGMRAAVETLGAPQPLLLGTHKWHPVESGFIRTPEQPEDVVLLDQDRVLAIYEQVGLRVERVSHGTWCGDLRAPTFGGGQDAIVAIKQPPAIG